MISVLQGWQGLGLRLGQPRLQPRLPLLAGLLLLSTFGTLPFLSRGGLAILLLGHGVLWTCWCLQEPARPTGAMGRALLLFLAVAVVATGFSPVPLAAATGLLKLVAYLTTWALAARLLRELPGWWHPVLAGLLLGAMAESVLALRQLSTGVEALATWSDAAYLSEGTTRVYGSLGNPNLLGGYLVPVVPLAAGAALHWRRPMSRLFAAATAILGTIAMFYSYSRGAWLGLAAALGCLLFLHAVVWLRRRHRQWLLPLLLLVTAVAVALIVLSLDPLQTRLASLFAGRADSSTNFRMNVWTAAWRMVQDRPWLGIGPGHGPFNRIYPLYQQPLFNALSAYSMPLELAVEMGLAGVVAGLAVVWTALQRGWRSVIGGTPAAHWHRWSATAAVVGLMAHGLVDTIFLRPEVQLLWWLCLAVLSVERRPYQAVDLQG